MNAYQNRQNERARWRQLVRRLRVRGPRLVKSYLWDLQAHGVLDKRHGGCGVSDNDGRLRVSRGQRLREAVNRAWQRVNRRRFARWNARHGEPF